MVPGKLVIILLAVGVAINASQGMVLCIGPHGHVAIEPAGHHHCASAPHTHDDVGAGHQETIGSELDHEHCEPCVDIPLSCEERLASRTASIRIPQAVAQGPAAAPADNLSVSVCSCHGVPAYHIPLRTVILQV